MDGKNTYLFLILFYTKKVNSFKFYIKKVSHNWDTLNIGVKRRDYTINYIVNRNLTIVFIN